MNKQKLYDALAQEKNYPFNSLRVAKDKALR